MSAQVALLVERHSGAQQPFLPHPTDTQLNLRPDLLVPPAHSPPRIPHRIDAQDARRSMRHPANCNICTADSGSSGAAPGESYGAMAESATSASALDSATCPSVCAPLAAHAAHAAHLSAYSNWGGALHGRAASFDFIPSPSGRNTSASRQSNVAFSHHQKQPSEQFDSLAATHSWLHSPSLDSNLGTTLGSNLGSRYSVDLATTASARSASGYIGETCERRERHEAPSRAAGAAAAFPAASSHVSAAVFGAPETAASRVLSPARDAAAAPAAAASPAASQRSSSAGSSSASPAVPRAAVCRPRQSPCRRPALGIADLMALKAGKSNAARSRATSPADGAAAAQRGAARAAAAVAPMPAPNLPQEKPFAFPSVSQATATFPPSASPFSAPPPSAAPPSARSATGAQFALRRSPPHINLRESAAFRFPRSMSDGQTMPRGSSRAKPVFPVVVARAEPDVKPELPEAGSSTGLPNLHQACSSGSAGAESRGCSRVGKSRLGPGGDGSGSNSSSRDPSPSSINSDNEKCDYSKCCDSSRGNDERPSASDAGAAANCGEAADQSRGGMADGVLHDSATTDATAVLKDVPTSQSVCSSRGNGGGAGYASGSNASNNSFRRRTAISIPTNHIVSTFPSSPTFRPSPLSPRGPSPLSPRLPSPRGPSPLFHRHPSPLSPCFPPPVSPWGPSPLSPRGLSPLSPRRPPPCPLSPRGPSPLSPRVATRPSPLHGASGFSFLQQQLAGSAIAGASVDSDKHIMHQQQQLQQMQLVQQFLHMDLKGFRSNSAPGAEGTFSATSLSPPQRRFSKGKRISSPLECSPVCSPDVQRVKNRHLLMTTRSDNSILPSGAGWATESAAAAVASGVPKSILTVKEEGAFSRTRSLDRRVRFNREVEVHVFS
ncbi:hypothetical protein CLOP_g5157 [Closterium sp. NIES-67]|nr:hypothetical protein CLOP_g5157 [Closterium sp. NIES-67]